ncbi:MAG: hypothetical protein V9G11_08020 [Bifidobacterium adolescentis]
MSEIKEGNLAEIKDLQRLVHDRRRFHQSQSTRSASKFPVRRSSAWWASPAPASP